MPSNTSRIAKNTLLLYFRQILTMLVSLYTVRIVLNVLGAENYGIYNVAGGLVVMFTFLNSAMTSATQRFLNFAMGQNDMEQARNVFSISIIIHILIAVLVIILAQTIGLWFFHTWLNIPQDRQNAALIVYQLSVAKAAISIIQVPYRAVIIANERMSFFALLSIVEVLLKLGVAFLLTVILFDQLIVYAFLVFIVVAVIFITYKIFCNKKFEISRFRFCKDKLLFRQLAEFSGWSVFGSVANVSSSRGTNVLINIFYGVTVNAAMGIATQVNSAVYSFVSNFQTAFRPQIVKSYAANDHNYVMHLLFFTSKVSFFLLFFFILPLYINAEFVLRIWLTDFPEYTIAFTRMILIISLLGALAGPLWISIHATGDIKKYHLVGSFITFTNLPLSFLFLWLGYSPVFILVIRFSLEVLLFIWRIYYLASKITFSLLNFLRRIILPVTLIAVISALVTIFFHGFFTGWAALIVSCIVSIICIASLVYFIGLNKQEKISLQNWIREKLAKQEIIDKEERYDTYKN